jgi:putative Mn2+ efflux pump MntP
VNQAAPLLSWATPAAISYGTALSATQLNATANVAGNFSYTPALGTVLGVGSQVLSVTFTPADAKDYAAATASVTIGVNQAAPLLSWATPAAISYGTALSATQLNAIANVAGSFSYTPALGAVLGVGSQVLSVAFTPADAKDYAAATASVAIGVNQAAPLLSWATPAAISYGTALSATQLNATANVAGSFSYTPALGTVLGVGSHVLSATFTPADAKDYAAATASVAIGVNQAIPVLIWATPAAISYGTALSATQLNATANVAGSFSYTPALGTVLGVGSQALSATFTPADTKDYAGATASVTVGVNQATPVLSWLTPAAISYGTVLSATQLNATANVAGSFAYNPPPGVVLEAGTQMLSVTFTPTDSVNFAPASGQVTLTVRQAMPQIVWPTPSAIVAGSALSSAQLNASAVASGGNTAIPGSFLYSPGAGTVFASPGPETLNVTFTPADVIDYASAEASVTLAVALGGVAAWGDSLTTGMEGVLDQGSYPNQLQSLVSLSVVNLGVGGQTSTQIGVREGGVPTYATVAGGVIPGSGSVSITFPAGFEPVTTQGPAAGVTGTIQGVHGTVKLNSGVYTFTPTLTGNPVSAPGSPRFVVDTPYVSYIPVFWEGRNNYSAKSQVLADIAAQVAAVPSGENYVVMSVLNEDTAYEGAGGGGYQQIIALNTQLSKIYGTHYLDIREILVSNYDSSQATDVTDFNHDEVPTSLHAVYAVGELSSAIGAGDTSLTVDLTTGTLATGLYLTIDTGANAENVLITGISGETVTVTRNVGGVCGAHAAGATVTESDMIHLNGKGSQIVANAVADYLSLYKNQEP